MTVEPTPARVAQFDQRQQFARETLDEMVQAYRALRDQGLTEVEAGNQILGMSRASLKEARGQVDDVTLILNLSELLMFAVSRLSDSERTDI